MSHCTLCGKGLPSSERLHQAEITVCKSCGTAVIALTAGAQPKVQARPPVKRYRRRSVFSKLWAFS